MKIQKDTSGDKTYTNITIARVDTKGKIISFEDASGMSKKDDGIEFFEKVVLNFTDYSKEGQTLNVRHYMDWDDFAVLANDVLFKMLKTPYEEFKGSKSKKFPSGFEGRELRVKYDDVLGQGKGGYEFHIRWGEGKAGDKGQVSINKESTVPVKEIKVIVSVKEARVATQSVVDFIRAKRSAMFVKEWDAIFPSREN